MVTSKLTFQRKYCCLYLNPLLFRFKMNTNEKMYFDGYFITTIHNIYQYEWPTFKRTMRVCFQFDKLRGQRQRLPDVQVTTAFGNYYI